MNKVIGIGEYLVSNDKNDILTTYALGSCVGITLYSKGKNAAGMIHIALPNPEIGNCKELRIGYYATTGIPRLFQLMKHYYGCEKEELIIQIFGGANSIRSDDVFFVGQKNLVATKEILDSMGVKYTQSNIGGLVSRTISMEVVTGDIRVETQKIKI